MPYYLQVNGLSNHLLRRRNLPRLHHLPLAHLFGHLRLLRHPHLYPLHHNRLDSPAQAPPQLTQLLPLHGLLILNLSLVKPVAMLVL